MRYHHLIDFTEETQRKNQVVFWTRVSQCCSQSCSGGQGDDGIKPKQLSKFTLGSRESRLNKPEVEGNIHTVNSPKSSSVKT